MESKIFKENTKECNCEKPRPDNNFHGGYKKPGIKVEGIFCHCLVCSGKIIYER